MPLRTQPKVYQILLKTHKLTVFLSATPTTTIASLKQEALSALTSEVSLQVDDVPKVTSVDQFELCQAVQERGTEKPSVRYVGLGSGQTVQGTLANWEVLFMQFRDDKGKLLPVEYTPPVDDDATEDEPRSRTSGLSSKGKEPAVDEVASARGSEGKRKRKAPE